MNAKNEKDRKQEEEKRQKEIAKEKDRRSEIKIPVYFKDETTPELIEISYKALQKLRFSDPSQAIFRQDASLLGLFRNIHGKL